MKQNIALQIVPVSKLFITDDSGNAVETMAGPYNEGTALNLTCKPQPQISWWRDARLIDETYFVNKTHANNKLTIFLTRNDFMMSLKCQASNNNLTSSVQRTIVIDLNSKLNREIYLVKPREVKIMAKHQKLKWNKIEEFVCETRGSKPSADVFWFNDRQQLVSSQTTSEDGFVTTSFVSFMPSIEDNGKNLTCVAINNQIPDFNLNDSITMEIECEFALSFLSNP
ncbi:protein turtle B-like protein [Dinothrombium tinctorium]|uniref:Protein turtle B-like protein n=1 Tax=Dinothrombium tinctorium TaxID=1965070 RepID=A0A3S4Q831_9ACAR|nr:protein turtle B-like protein [Dinothrombium tinctorium]